MDLDLLKQAGAFDAGTDMRFATVAELAAVCCHTAGAAVVLMGDGQQLHCRARVGIAEAATAVLHHFCRRVLNQCSPVALPCAPTPATEATPTGWAGAPVLLPDTGRCVGAVVVSGLQHGAPQSTEEVLRVLELLASQVAHFLAADIRMAGEWQRVTQFVARVSHELRTPLTGIL
eukprot:EG_transcript_33056